jgi:hypothetical protein
MRLAVKNPWQVLAILRLCEDGMKRLSTWGTATARRA